LDLNGCFVTFANGELFYNAHFAFHLRFLYGTILYSEYFIYRS